MSDSACSTVGDKPSSEPREKAQRYRGATEIGQKLSSTLS